MEGKRWNGGRLAHVVKHIEYDKKNSQETDLLFLRHTEVAVSDTDAPRPRLHGVLARGRQEKVRGTVVQLRCLGVGPCAGAEAWKHAASMSTVACACMCQM